MSGLSSDARGSAGVRAARDNAGSAGAPLPFAQRLRPAPLNGGLRDPEWWIWCGSCARGEDGRYHLFASRWPRSYPWFGGYFSRSEVVRAVGDRPEGPFKVVETVLPSRHPSYWDGRITHNPAVLRWRDRWLLFYIGATYEYPVPQPTDLTNRNTPDSFAFCTWWRLRIGVAQADRIDGPWTRPDRPTFAPRGMSEVDGFWDWAVVTNPAPFVGHDGALYMGFRTTPRGQIGIARADGPEGPFVPITNGPIFDPGWYVEDICIWWDGERYQLIGKDNQGGHTGRRHALLHAWSPDLQRWRIHNEPLVLDRRIAFADGRERVFARAERPQVLIEDGRPTCLYLAVAEGPFDNEPGTYLQWSGSWNLAVPLMSRSNAR